MSRLLALWCRIWHMEHWLIASADDRNATLLGCYCQRCERFHVVEVRVGEREP